MTHKSSPKIPPNLSLHVLWLKFWNFISASFWGSGASLTKKRWQKEHVNLAIDLANYLLGRTSQPSGIGVDFPGDCDGFCDGFFGQEGRILRRILWRIFSLVFLSRKRRILGRILGPWELGQRRNNGENNLGVKIHSKIHDQNPRRAKGETCCLHLFRDAREWDPDYGGKDLVTTCFFSSVGRKRGQRKGATSKNVKNCQKLSVKHMFDVFFDIFRAGQKKTQKTSKSVKNIFDTFRAAPVFRPVLGGSDFWETYRAIAAGPTPLARNLSEHLPPDLIWTRFWPDLDRKSPFSGPNQVRGEVLREGQWVGFLSILRYEIKRGRLRSAS